MIFRDVMRNIITKSVFLTIFCSVLSGCWTPSYKYKQIDTKLHRDYSQASDSRASAKITVIRKDKYLLSGVTYIISENNQIVGTITNGGRLSWKTKPGKIRLSVEKVQAIYCRTWPMPDDVCMEDRENLYTRIEQNDPVPTLELYVRSGSKHLVRFEPFHFSETIFQVKDR